MLTKTPRDRVRKQAWGWTTALSPAEHFLEFEKGGVCSKHYHTARMNRFWIHTGRVVIRYWFADEMREVQLGPNDVFDVPSLVVHQFEALTDGTMSEFYYADRGGEVRADDIVRMSDGFRREATEIP